MAFESEIHTWSPELTRPLCPDCGRVVRVEFYDWGNPTTPFRATCPLGHIHTYQMEEED